MERYMWGVLLAHSRDVVFVREPLGCSAFIRGVKLARPAKTCVMRSRGSVEWLKKPNWSDPTPTASFVITWPGSSSIWRFKETVLHLPACFSEPTLVSRRCAEALLLPQLPHGPDICPKNARTVGPFRVGWRLYGNDNSMWGHCCPNETGKSAAPGIKLGQRNGMRAMN